MKYTGKSFNHGLSSNAKSSAESKEAAVRFENRESIHEWDRVQDAGLRIKERREEIGMTQEELAELSEVTQPYIGRLENKTRPISIKTLVNLSIALDVSTDFILFGSMR